ncbi:methyl-accepting chemotaxis protein [Halanaerocella petrolearia]
MKSIRKKILSSFVLVTIIALVLMGAVLYFQFQNTITPLVSDMAMEIVKGRRAEVGEWINGIIKKTKEISRRKEIKSLQWNKSKDILVKEQQRKSSLYKMMFIADKTGDAHTTSNKQSNISDRRYFQKIMNGQQSVISNPIISKSSQRPVFVVAHAIKDNNNNTIGVFGVTITLAALSNRVDDIQIADAGFGWVVDNTGLIVAHPEDKMTMSLNVLESKQQGFKGLNKLGEKIVNGKEGYGDIVRPNGDEMLLTFAPIPNTPNWTLGVSIPQHGLLKRIDNLIKTVILTIAIVIMIMIGVSYLIGKNITQPIKELSQKVLKFGDGDFTVEFDVDSNDEVGQMSTALTEMKNELKEMIVEILDIVENLSAHSEELSASAQEGNATIETTNQLVEQISSSIEQISASAEEISNLAQEANKQTEIGSQNINQTVANIEEINQVVNRAVKVIDSLATKSEEIEKIVDLINDIAEQTNLLALNAAIESARVSSANKLGTGQGFAVVAEEIRNLAEDTAEATDDIDKLITDMQNESKVGLETIEEVKDKVNEGKQITHHTDQVFVEIKNSTTEAAKNIEEAVSATEDLNEDSQEVVTATQDITKLSDEIAVSAQQLTSMAEQLQSLVDKFEV